jgi:hypothetical protein
MRATPSAVTAAAAAVAVVAVAGAIADFRRTEDRVPPIPPLCAPESTTCDDARNAQLGVRLDRIHQIEREYDGRAWLYAAIVVGAVAVATVVALRHGRPRRVFANLGAIGVGAAIAVTLVLYLGAFRPRTLELPAGPLYAPAGALLLAAAIGGGLTRWDPGAAEALPRVSRGRLARGVAVVGWGLTGLTILLAWLFGAVQPGCGSEEQPPSWDDAVAAATLATVLAGVVVAVVALVLRRWVTALVWVLVGPAALFYLAASSCAFD